MEITLNTGPWRVACAPRDGARLTRLAIGERALLTGPPERFRPPVTHPGLYKTRPVFGYDDCFPTVDPCNNPADGRALSDHGLLCWRPWNVSAGGNEMWADVEARGADLRFVRGMQFRGNTLRWVFRVVNRTSEAVRFLHVMHGLMPVADIRNLELPSCAHVVEETTGRSACDPTQAAAWLLGRPARTAEMILLRRIEAGAAALHWTGGGRLRIQFDSHAFPTLAIWWNRGGFPNEKGLRRWECAFEPMAGPWSSLARSAAEGRTQTAPPRATTEWSIEWKWEGAEPCR